MKFLFWSFTVNFSINPYTMIFAAETPSWYNFRKKKGGKILFSPKKRRNLDSEKLLEEDHTSPFFWHTSLCFICLIKSFPVLNVKIAIKVWQFFWETVQPDQLAMDLLLHTFSGHQHQPRWTHIFDNSTCSRKIFGHLRSPWKQFRSP